MQFRTTLFALALAAAAAPLSAQIVVRDPARNPRRGQGTTVGDIIFGRGTMDTTSRQCRVRDAVTPDGRIVQICDDRRVQNTRRHGDDDEDDDDDRFEHENRGARGDDAVNDRDGDGDFDAQDRAIRKQQHELQKQQRKAQKAQLESQSKRLRASRKRD